MEYDRALFVKSDDIRKARGKQSVEYRKPSVATPLSVWHNNIAYLNIVNIFRVAHKSIANSSELHGPDGRPHTNVVTVEISESTDSAFG